MDLFTPLVSEDQQHPYFRLLTQPNFGTQELEVIKSWANGFIDRDGKFAKEFQTTFNSSFWELYLSACFRELGCTVDFSHETPDFSVNSPYGDFIAEATITNHPDGFRPEWDKNLDLLPTTSTEDILRLSTIRLSNAISSKYKKYISKYSKLNHVQNKPFVICVAPFDQPFFHFQDSLAIVRLLYAFESTLTITNHSTNETMIVGESRCFQIQKSSKVSLDLGLFTDDRMPEVSAVIFSTRATFCKVRALAKEGNNPVVFIGARMIQLENLTGFQPFITNRPDYQETILDGLHILINPFANYPLELKLFDKREVAIHSYDPETDSYLSEIPNDFLIQRSCQSMFFSDTTVDLKRTLTEHPYQELSPEVWQEDILKYVGGQNDSFRDNHMAHYRGWTVLVCFDSIDQNWGTQAVNKLCYNIPQYMKANGDDSLDLTLLTKWFSTKEDAYIAIKQKIDQIFDQVVIKD